MTPTSELEAVNELLASIGETPVNTLMGVLPVDAASARSLIHSTSRRLQKRGWSFNFDEGYRLAPDANGEIILPPDTLSVDPSDGAVLVQRGNRLYDPAKHTFEIGKPVKVDIVRALDFEELPEAARDFVVVSAGVRFQDRFIGDDPLRSYTAADERSAWAAFLSTEAEMADYNVLTSSPAGRIVRRRRG